MKMLLLVAMAGGVLFAQSDAPLAFEVASVKQHPIPFGMMRRPWSPNIDCGPIAKCGVSGNRFTEVASLTDLIMDAYSVKRFQIAGLPDWGDSGHDIYDIDARAAADRPLTLDQSRRMLQTLLAERFQLKIHHEMKELPVYALVPGKNGPKLKPTDKPCALPQIPGANGGRGGDKGGGRAVANGGGGLSPLQSWALMPEMLSQFVDRPVIDKTGLKEAAYCTLDGLDPLFTVIMQVGPAAGGGRGGAPPPPVDRGADADPGSSIFTAVEEKWGMKLEPQKGQADILVIDRVARPLEN